ncbi:hypothetical protein D3C71_2014500 [compost metagenome]
MRGTCRERQLERVAILVARNVLAHIAVPLRVTWQTRVVVDPVALQRHPIGPKVAFLEHVHANTRQPRQGHGRAVYRAAVAEQHQVGDIQLAEHP